MIANTSNQLSNAFPEKLVILDLETTGLKASCDRIIEIGFLKIERGIVVERYNTFINPKVSLPAEIVLLTGIRQKDVIEAPYFEEIASVLYEKIKDSVLIAHNARFDYGFLHHEFKRCDIKYQTKPLCTVKLSRSLYPQHKKHGLDKIIDRFDLFVIDRHRALADAMLVYQFLIKLSQHHNQAEIQTACDDQLKQAVLPPNVNLKKIQQLPKSSGVYYFYDADGSLLYIGKSVNIRQRVLSHFSADLRNAQDMKLSPHIHEIDWQETPSDFSAQILESQEIKNKHPLYNKRLRKVGQLYHFEISHNKAGYLTPKIKALKAIEGNDDESIGLFRSKRQAEKTLKHLAEEYELCHKLLGLDKSNSNRGCFQYQLKKCLGACVGKEETTQYNERFNQALESFQIKVWPWESSIVIAEKSHKNNKHTCFHLINRWCYLGRFTTIDELLVSSNDSKHQKSLDDNLMEGFDLDIYKILVKYLLNSNLLKQEGFEVMSLNKIAA